MLTDLYVSEKLRKLEVERARRAPPRPPSTPSPVLGPLVRAAGKVLRRAGEGLESWAAPAVPESDGARLVAARQRTGSTFTPREEGC